MEPRDPFELIIWENAAYLVDDARRSCVFDTLKAKIGVTPMQLIAAGSKKIEAAIKDGGMQPPHRAAKVLHCAEIAIEFADGDLASTLKTLPAKKARKLLKRFPGIGDPGADKILLLCGFANNPGLDSNGLRVLERLGVIAVSNTYSASYRAGVALLVSEKVTGNRAKDAFALLREHGRVLCKRNNPECPRCPLRDECRYALVQKEARLHAK